MKRVVDVAVRHPHYSVDTAILESIIHTLDAWEAFSIPAGELSIALTSGPELARLHAHFLNNMSPTDVITFLGDTDADFAGEICLSIDQAVLEAALRDGCAERECVLYLVHGWLHLAGLDDLHAAARATMRTAEAAALEYLKSRNVQVTGWLRKR
ncbi:MAG: rRNA maturation RNase YbeY [Opitutales bacterium]